jgi:hypothetical protein
VQLIYHAHRVIASRKDREVSQLQGAIERQDHPLRCSHQKPAARREEGLHLRSEG